MKSVLISIQPKWVEKIASGEKTIEVRKTRPNLPTPFKCYIYCTKSRTNLFWVDEEIKDTDGLPKGLKAYNSRLGNGAVIGEFTCNRIDYISPSYGYIDARCVGGVGFILDKCCLTSKEFIEYGKGKPLYGWHISNLKIYDKPKSLEMFPIGKVARDCGYGNYNIYDKILTRPPQSWCYVEV